MTDPPDPATPPVAPPATPQPAAPRPRAGDGPGATRTTIVLADITRRPETRHTATELTQQSPVGDALLRGLIRAQLAHAIRLAGVLAVGLGGLPLLFAVAPTVAGARPLGVGLPWLLLGVAAYPFLFVLGATYVHQAERTEAEFTDLVERPDR